MSDLVQLHLMIPPEDKAQAQADAHKLQVTLSEYIRRLIATGHGMIERAEK